MLASFIVIIYVGRSSSQPWLIIIIIAIGEGARTVHFFRCGCLGGFVNICGMGIGVKITFG